MAYFNFDLALNKAKLLPKDLILLQIIHQNRIEDCEDYLKTAKLDAVQPYITYIKGKKGQTTWQKIRLNKEGKDLLELIQTPEITAGDVDMFNYLCEMYLSSDDEERRIGNKKKVLKYITCFRKHLSLSLHEMYYLCEEYLSQLEYTKVLEYIFMKPSKTGFYKKFENNIDDSPLFQWYDENKAHVEFIWAQKIGE